MTGDSIGRNDAFLRQLFFLVVLAAIGVILFSQLQFFIGSILGGITIYVVIRKVMFRMVEKRGMRHWVAALLLVCATTLVLGAFGWLSVKALGPEVSNLRVADLLSGINTALDRVNDALGLNIIPQDIIDQSDGFVKEVATGVLNATYSFVANIFLMMFVLYFMLTSGRRMEKAIWDYAPFRDQSLVLIKHEVKTMIYSNAVGMPVILVLQALVSTLIYWLVGFGNPWFWGLLTALCGLLPIVGTTIVYLPVAVWLFSRGEVLNSIILLTYGLVVISNTDNVFRIVLLRRVADTHPLVVIFGVLLGIPMFGFWGIIFGPLFISGFVLLIRIYYMEYGLLDDPAAGTPKNAPVRKSVPPHFSRIHRTIIQKLASPAPAPAPRRKRKPAVKSHKPPEV
jgi:predicted PurR-regulated permease PerM